jgi:hypothetical protein
VAGEGGAADGARAQCHPGSLSVVEGGKSGEPGSSGHPVLWVLAIVGGVWVLAKTSELLREAGFRYPEESETALWIAVAVIALAALRSYWLGADVDLAETILRRKPLAWSVAAVLFAWFFTSAGMDDRDSSFVADYCRYGATSEVQLDGCLRNVDEEEVKSGDTSAARFARGRQECLSDSGPFCEEAIANRLAADEAAEQEADHRDPVTGR